VNEGRPEKPNVWFWLAVAGAVLTVPIVALTTCGVSGGFNAATSSIQTEANTATAVVIGIPVAVVFGWAAFRLWPKEPPGRNQQRFGPGGEPFPPPPGEWQARWRQPSQGSDPSVRRADSPIREPPEANQ
jgi:hypothetical protein